ncbi:MAG: zinc ribbon domain-containing protein [Chloroflexi bacterium]|nr:zinc ribbon domain-containing protein [Chloroflexota bacterium]
MNDLLQQGITAYKAGKREEARRFFISAVKQNPQSELAWGWMYQTSVSEKERIYCLKQMLRINPKNEKTSQLLRQHLEPASAPVPPPAAEVNPPKVEEVKCPHCGEPVRVGAPRCKYCGRDLKRVKTVPAKKDSKNLINFVIAIITMAIICGLIYGLALVAKSRIDAIPTPTRSPHENAWHACILFVEKQEKVAAFDAQRFTPDGVILLDNGQYRVDVSYAKLAITYTCVLSDHSDGKWELISLTATQE